MDPFVLIASKDERRINQFMNNLENSDFKNT